MADQALILAAGRGRRLEPLTLHTPKPLLEVGGRRLIEWHLDALARAGVRDVVINIAHLRERFAPALGDGSRYGLTINYSDEGTEPLETGGGMLHALALLRDAPFIVVNADVYAEVDFSRLRLPPQRDAHLLLVPNPPEHRDGDIWLCPDGQVDPAPATMTPNASAERLTYAGIGVYSARLFNDWRDAYPDHRGALLDPPRFPLAALLKRAMRERRISGERHCGNWHDIGTPDRLARLRTELAGSNCGQPKPRPPLHKV